MERRRFGQTLEEYIRRCPYPVTLVYLFGSAVREQRTPLSDVDVAVYLDEPDRARRVKVYASLLLDLRQVLGDGSVDLVYLNDASPVLAYQIITGRLLYCADERQRVTVETRALRDYFDERPLEQTRHRLLRARIMAGRMGERSGEMIDERTVNERLAYIDVTLAHLKSRRALSLAELRADEDKRGATLYELQTCIEAITDIGNHFIAALGLRKPKNRGEIPLILAEAGIITEPLARRLVQAVGLRNVLVHGYLDLALTAVYQTIQENLDDVEVFSRKIVQYMSAMD
ncbi:MAG: HepT-like ribonuclease domain-containing protein [Anaerolineae bacterium]